MQTRSGLISVLVCQFSPSHPLERAIVPCIGYFLKRERICFLYADALSFHPVLFRSDYPVLFVFPHNRKTGKFHLSWRFSREGLAFGLIKKWPRASPNNSRKTATKNIRTTRRSLYQEARRWAISCISLDAIRSIRAIAAARFVQPVASPSTSVFASASSSLRTDACTADARSDDTAIVALSVYFSTISSPVSARSPAPRLMRS
jgi:hypothetical protein